MFAASGASGSDKIKIAGSLAGVDSLKVWIFFTDKGSGLTPLSKKVAVSDKATIRRSRRGTNVDSDFLDREINDDYVKQLEPSVQRICQRSRWLNAISAYTTPRNLSAIADLECVKEIERVAVYARRETPISDSIVTGLDKLLIPYPPDYGPSYSQLSQIQVVDLHNLGLTGVGITILILDTGFKLSHPVFSRLHIDSTWDFVNNDVDVEDASDIPRLLQQEHGTSTLSLISGYAPGDMIGVAYDAQFLMAKTEIVNDTDVYVEEDNWVAGIEWGERLGADVATSSLGYPDFYTYSQLDGNTAVTAKAASYAVSLGVVVANAVGNEGHSSTRPTLVPPSDGIGVIAVGAVDGGGTIAGFSSNGPTADGRIKPDLCARGSGDRVANYLGGYRFGSGTSFSTPLVAGAAALLLQAHPDWNNSKVYQALIMTATQAASPDTVYGYGIAQALGATNYVGDSNSVTISGYIETATGEGIAGVTLTGLPYSKVTAANGYYIDTVLYGWSGTVTPTLACFTFVPPSRTYTSILIDQTHQDFVGTRGIGTIAFPNPFRDSVSFGLELTAPGMISVQIYDVAGERVADKSESGVSGPRVVTINCRDLAGGVYIAYITAPGITTTKKIVKL